MHSSAPAARRGMLAGAVEALAADALFLPTGLVAAAFLTRSLGATGYGLFTLAATLIEWIDRVIASAFSAAVVKFVGETEDWRPVGRAAVQLHLAVGAAAALGLWVLAEPLAALWHEPVLRTHVRLFALGLPVYSLASAHRSVLIGRGDFKQRALASAGRALGGPLLIIALVELGLSVSGAILGNIGACAVEIVVARRFVRPAFLGRSSFPPRRLWGYAVPLFVFAVSLRLFTNLDLFALKALGGSAAQAGLYGAAQDLAIVPGYLLFCFIPLLLSALTRLVHGGDAALARALTTNSLRVVTALLPFVAILAGAASEIVTLLFGAGFAPAAPIFVVLAVGVVGRAAMTICTTVMTVAGRPGWTAALAVPLVPAALAGHWWLIPRFGPLGAAFVTATLSLLAAGVGLGGIHRLWGIRFPSATLLRSLALCGPAYGMAALWPAPGPWVLVKIPVIALTVLLAVLALGELRAEEVALVRSIIARR